MFASSSAAPHTSSLPVCRLGTEAKLPTLNRLFECVAQNLRRSRKGRRRPNAWQKRSGRRREVGSSAIILAAGGLRREGARGLDAAIPAANRHLIYREPGHRERTRCGLTHPQLGSSGASGRGSERSSSRHSASILAERSMELGGELPWECSRCWVSDTASYRFWRCGAFPPSPARPCRRVERPIVTNTLLPDPHPFLAVAVPIILAQLAKRRHGLAIAAS